MITFRDVVREERLEEKTSYLAWMIAARDAQASFAEAGELEQAVLDARNPRLDDWGDVERHLRELNLATGAAFLADRRGASCDAALRRAAELLGRVDAIDLPARLMVRPPEGYSHYGLDPLGYARAAERYEGQVGKERASRAVVIGIRSVGTSLSATVAARLRATRTFTVRPRGASGARSVATTERLRDTLLDWLHEGGDALVVDEGPGATGETFLCVVRWLREIGVDRDRIVLFPSHLGLPGLATPEVRDFFERSRRFAPPNSDERVAAICAAYGLVLAADLSAGRWRSIATPGEPSVAIGRHERLKYLARAADGRSYLIRYAGLGRSGTEAALRASCLASAGFGPEVVGSRWGFIINAWIDGEPVTTEDRTDASFARTLADYLRVRSTLFRTATPVDIGPILSMLRENAEEVLGKSTRGLSVALERLSKLPLREAVVPDARMHRREWLRSADRYFKLDATDHGDDVRFPGPADVAWDLAAAAVEFGFDEGELDWLIRRGRTPAAEEKTLGVAVAAYRAPYAAAQLGEAALAAREAAGSEDGVLLQAEVDRYATLLRRELDRAAAVPYRARTPSGATR